MGLFTANKSPNLSQPQKQILALYKEAFAQKFLLRLKELGTPGFKSFVETGNALGDFNHYSDDQVNAVSVALTKAYCTYPKRCISLRDPSFSGICAAEGDIQKYTVKANVEAVLEPDHVRASQLEEGRTIAEILKLSEQYLQGGIDVKTYDKQCRALVGYVAGDIDRSARGPDGSRQEIGFYTDLMMRAVLRIPAIMRTSHPDKYETSKVNPAELVTLGQGKG